MSPVGAIFVPFPPKTGTNMLHPRPPAIVELVSCGCSNKGVGLLGYHRFPKLPPLYVSIPRSLPDPPSSFSVAVTGRPKAASMATSLLGRHFSELCCFIRSRRGLTGREL